ncbi:hypothetical protein L2E82_35206 [Cichorium intybus]|uniref:Uncharacterized protein n=1 Tax=Cichorium intybus TaxID=13427 RepID=A0ACB9BNG7_CICIN|nr:hypothetical protein L2E82_35206 [Cichorium intybus]
MGKSPRKKPRLPKANPKADEEPKSDPAPIILSSDDEADDDLSLKIVEKAMLRAGGNETNAKPSLSSSKSEGIPTEVKRKTKKRKEKMGARDNAVEEPKSDPAPIILSSNNEFDIRLIETNPNPSSSSKPEEIVTEVNKKMKKRKDRKKEKMGAQDSAVEDVEMKEEDVTLETNPSEKSDNIVLRKLLRGPRYFDPPDNNWGNCYNCGEGGHITANCTSARRKKPCFVCGSLEHNVKQCNKGKDCFICKKGGHRAKDCPEKSISQNAKICLKCGDSGHEMFSCKSAYSPDDLKEIQCYVCKCFGHLCCVNYTDAGPTDVSCYRCGHLGHNGWECARVHAETTSNGTPSSCYKCGQEGHMARKCTTSTKKEKRKGEYSSPRKSRSRDNDRHNNHVGARSVPHDYKKNYGKSSSSQTNKRKSRGGWMTEDPHPLGDWASPSPKFQDRYKSNERLHTHNHTHNHNHSGGGYSPGFHSNSNGRKLHYESSNSNGYQHRFSASRFGNSSSYGKRDYSWDY